jgi:hypothetical protein
MKKMLVVPVVILTLLIGQVASAFSDVTESTDYSASIEWMSDNGVIQGYPDGTFKPDQCVNRAEFLKMMYLSLDTNIIIEDGFAGSNYYDNFFSDTSTDQWYWPYLEHALREQAIEGYPDGTFKPGQCVNRAEAVKMAVLGFEIYNENADTEREAREETLYNDAMPGEHWFEAYLYSAIDRNAAGKEHVFTIEDGYYFDPGESMSRKEVAEMLYRMKTLTDNEVFGYVESMSPNPLNYYVSPSNGVSFLMPEGWWVIHDDFYTTASDVVADYPSILINGPTEAGEETVAINQRQMDCGTHEFAATCHEINENYTIGVYDPSLEANYLINKIMLTFREPDGVVEGPFSYHNRQFNLSFDIPKRWDMTEEVMNVGDHAKLIINLEKVDMPDVSVWISTPPVERGLEGMKIEDGLERQIEGLTLFNALLISDEAGGSTQLTALNMYYIYESDWISSIEFNYTAPDGNTFDTYLEDYYFILDSVEFTNSSEVAFDGCGVPSDYATEDWWPGFVGTWDDYALTLEGDFPLHDALQDSTGDYCLALDKSMFIFIPAYHEGGGPRIFKYDIIDDVVSKATTDGPYYPREFGARSGDYIPVIGIHEYYGCEFITGNYYYLENRIDTSVATTCTN